MNLLKGTAAGLAMAAGLFASAQASDLSGTLKIFLGHVQSGTARGNGKDGVRF